MKKSIFRLAMVALVGVIVFGSCTKKGEDDPFMSFRSRKARLAGEWVLSSVDMTSVNSYGGSSYSSQTSYNGTVMTYSSDGYSSTSVYSEDLTIEKDGTYSMSTIDDGDASTEDGNWMWIDKNKNQDLKNKEAVLFARTSSFSSNGSSTYSGKSNFSDAVVIQRLSNKELVILFDYSSIDSDGDTYSSSGTMTYTQD